MALLVKKGVVASPSGVNNTVAVDLSADGFGVGEPLKAVLVFATRATVDEFHAAARASIGWGFFRASGLGNAATVSLTAENNVGTTVDAVSGDKTVIHLAELATTTTTSTYFRVTRSAWADTGFTLQFPVPVTGLRIHYLAIGGSDVTNVASNGSQTTTATATQNFTAGFQPDLVVMLSQNRAGLGIGAVSPGIGLGVGNADGEQRCTTIGLSDNSATSAITQTQDATLVTMLGATPTAADAIGSLAAVGSWPATGFQVAWSDVPTAGRAIPWLALEFSANVTTKIGADVARTTAGVDSVGPLPSGTVKGAFLWGWPLLAAAGVRLSDSQLGGFNIGATDGTTEGAVGFAQNDADTNEFSTSLSTVSKALRLMDGAGQTVAATASPVQQEADAAFNGASLDLTWAVPGAIPAVREFNYLLLGEVSSGAALTGTLDDSIGVDDALASAAGYSAPCPPTRSPSTTRSHRPRPTSEASSTPPASPTS